LNGFQLPKAAAQAYNQPNKIIFCHFWILCYRSL